jgi:hypothetical protein
MFNSLFARMRRYVAPLALLAGVGVAPVEAAPLEEVGLEFGNDGVVATIRLSGPVQYQSHSPQSHGQTLEIFYTRTGAAGEKWLDGEVRNSPPSRLIPNFSVTSRDQQTKPRLVVQFAREAEYSVAPGKDGSSIVITIRPDRQLPVSDGPLPLLPMIAPEAKPAAGVTLSATEAALLENNKQARVLMVQGRDALGAKDNDAAILAFNKLLMLPPNDYTQDAQEWVGVARERAGQNDKAKVEYDLYLRLFPDGPGAARVVRRLAGLSAVPDQQLSSAPKKKQEASMVGFGSVTSRYYFGKSKIDSTFTFNGVTTSDSLSLTDQSMIITSIDASERYRSEEYDARLVFRDVNTRNLVSGQPSLNRVNAAYGEFKDRTRNYQVRVGRQSPTSNTGVMGRFDGLAGSYGEAADFRVNANAGTLNDYSMGGMKPKFFGASVDVGAFSVYSISQTVEGYTDRRAAGAEYRYYEDKNSLYGLLDYDMYFKAVNAAQLMGSTGFRDGTLNIMIDHRKAPSLGIRNALMGATTPSVAVLRQTMTAKQVKDLAWQRTATSNMGQFGVTLPWRGKWQVGADLRLMNTSGLPASGIQPVAGTTADQGYVYAIPSRGLEKSLIGQITGSNIYSVGDVWSGSLAISSGASAKGNVLYLYNHRQFNSGWTLDTSFALSKYTDQFGGKLDRKSPMLRGGYRIGERFYVDVDGGIELIDYSGAQSTTKTTRYFYSAGLRWDF